MSKSMSPRFYWCDRCGVAFGVIIGNEESDPTCPICKGVLDEIMGAFGEASNRLVAFAVVEGRSKV